MELWHSLTDRFCDETLVPRPLTLARLNTHTASSSTLNCRRSTTVRSTSIIDIKDTSKLARYNSRNSMFIIFALVAALVASSADAFSARTSIIRSRSLGPHLHSTPQTSRSIGLRLLATPPPTVSGQDTVSKAEDIEPTAYIHILVS
jgi:hypothetical protein